MKIWVMIGKNSLLNIQANKNNPNQQMLKDLNEKVNAKDTMTIYLKMYSNDLQLAVYAKHLITLKALFAQIMFVEIVSSLDIGTASLNKKHL